MSKSTMLILNASDVERSLPMKEAVAGMKQAFMALHRGEIVMPPRVQMPVADENAISLTMPSYVGGDQKALAVKVVGIFPNNVEKSQPRIQGALIAFDPVSGAPLALLDGAMLTGIRTAAVSGLATDYLARQDSEVLGVLGAGVQAKTHIEAMCCVRPIKHIKVFSRMMEKAKTLVEEVVSKTELAVEIVAVDSARLAICGSDIVCCTTSSSSPIFANKDLDDGAHINAVGSSQLCDAEVPSETVARAKVIVDQREAAFEEAGDLMQPINAGLIAQDHVLAELGEIAAGARLPSEIRTSASDVTFFKSVGLAMQDAFAARICVENARAIGAGQSVDW